MRIINTIATLLLASALALGGCDLEVGDLNNPGIDSLEDNPTPSAVSAACTGLLIGNRGNYAAANGYVLQLGVLGREAYNFDQADPRYVGELLGGPLNPGSPFGGNFWAGPYANIRLSNIILKVVDNVTEYSDEEKSAVKGFAETIQALDLLEVIVTRDTNGAVIDTDRELDEELGPIADKDAVYAKIADLLDDGAAKLMAGGEEFPFALSSGYAGFDTPATFREFNRAIRARVAAYTKDYAVVLSALEESFLNADAMTLGELNVGVYHSYSTASGDTTNGLINPNIYVHPSVAADAQMGDQRLERKTEVVDEAGGAGLTSDRKFTIYTSPSSPVPIIRNEELILLRAEAEWATNDLAGAIDDLNVVRTISGGLAALSAGSTADQVEDEILYNRRYSLLFEGGHRWIDLRRFERTDELPLDMADFVRNIRYPIPLAECNARPDEPRCMLGST